MRHIFDLGANHLAQRVLEGLSAAIVIADVGPAVVEREAEV